MEKHWEDMTPAERVISVFGGVRATARAIGKSPSRVSRWQFSKDKGGTDGRIPSSSQKKVLEIAAAQGLTLTAADLIG